MPATTANAGKITSRRAKRRNAAPHEVSTAIGVRLIDGQTEDKLTGRSHNVIHIANYQNSDDERNRLSVGRSPTEADDEISIVLAHSANTWPASVWLVERTGCTID